MAENKFITFFNQGDSLTLQFNPRPWRGSNFYWVHDRFYSHVSNDKQDRYLHLFVRPLDSIKFYFRDQANFEDAIAHYKKNSALLGKAYENGNRNPLAYNPPILRSDDILIPNLILDFGSTGSNIATVIHPTEHIGVRVRLFDDTHIPIPFDEIPQLNVLLPQLSRSIPFILKTNDPTNN